MNAAELLASRGGREPAESDSVTAIITTLPVEVALARDASDRGMRNAWRDRNRGRSTPLLVVADTPGVAGQIRVLGPTDERAGVREIHVDRLAALLDGTIGKSRLLATREIAEELSRLDEGGVPGVVVKDLLTRHLVTTRLRQSDHWPLFEKSVGGVASADDWRAILTHLGYELERRRAPARGWLARREGHAVVVIHPYADPAAFARLDDDARPPESALLIDASKEHVPFAVLASGTRMRLFRAIEESEASGGAATTRYLELDAAALRPEDRPLLALLGPDSLRRGGIFEELLADARRFGAQLRARLDEQMRVGVLPDLARGLGSWASQHGLDMTDPTARTEIEASCLTWAFRALFILYAESAGYLPLDHPGYAANAATTLTEEAAASLDMLDATSTSLWDRFTVLVRALRTGDVAAHVPAYNGELFSATGLPGATLLERATLPNATFGHVLAALGRDPESGTGVDFSSLEIGHLGHIYEGLLSLRLTVADANLGLYKRGSGASADYIYEPVRKKSDDVEVSAGELFWQTNTGSRKAGGVYYTPAQLVDHLVGRAVVPALDRHLDEVRALAKNDPNEAAAQLFAFRVLDPACGSAHFLVVALHRMAERIGQFLAETPLPAVRDELEALRARASAGHGERVEHAELLHRLVLKRCIYGLDLSPMGAEVARLSLWLASFVPGLSLAYLGHNIQVGDALLGVASTGVLVEEGAGATTPFWADAVEEAAHEAAAAAAELTALADRTPDEYVASLAADKRLHESTAAVRRLFDSWTAGPLGLPKARAAVATTPGSVLDGTAKDIAGVTELSAKLRFFHWPLGFPEIFVGNRPGFDAVVGNPPWEEVTVEELAFYARYFPRMRGLTAGPREAALEVARSERPELAQQLRDEQERVTMLKQFLGPNGGYERTAGDPDLYKFFCMRYRALLADGGRLGVVLPRSAFLAAGSRGFRQWMFGLSTVDRLDFLLNTGRWAFDAEPRYTVSLVIAAASRPSDDAKVEVAGIAASSAAFASQSSSPGIALHRNALGPNDEVPLLPSQAAEPVLRQMRAHGDFAHGGGRWRCFPTRELHETDDKKLWEDATSGWELWKGESFDQHDPHGAEARWCPASEKVMKKVYKPKPGSESVLADEVPLAQRRSAQKREVESVRLAFRDVTNRTNSRTVISSLIPRETLLTNKAPYLVFVEGSHRERAACCALLNSLPFDWQARRFVETNMSYFILELLTVPAFPDDDYDELVQLGARLSCPDERFAEVADACGVQVGHFGDEQRMAMRARIDALVARAYGLKVEALDIMLDDFTNDAVSNEHREALRRELTALWR